MKLYITGSAGLPVASERSRLVVAGRTRLSPAWFMYPDCELCVCVAESMMFCSEKPSPGSNEAASRTIPALSANRSSATSATF
jgi:hypothetical protein